MWIVMTSSASMPNSCKGRYRNVAIVKVAQHYAAWGKTPAMISLRARGVLDLRHLGHHNEGKTERCAYRRVLAEARRRVAALNSAAPEATGELLASWGGSA